MGMGKMLRKLFVMLSLLVFVLANGTVVDAANWQWVKSNSKTTLTMDTSSISKNDGIYTVWVRLKYVYTDRYVNNKRIDYSVEEWKYKKDGNGYLVRTARTLAYGDEELLADRTYNSEWRDVVPNTFGEDVLNNVLKQRAEADKLEDTQARKQQQEEQKRQQDAQVAKTAKEKKDRDDRNRRANTEAAGSVLGGILGGILSR